MDQRVGKLWVAALRSGEFTQAEEKLAAVDVATGEVKGHCCLGVLSELAVREGIIPPPVPTSENYDGEQVPDPTDADRLRYGTTGIRGDYSTTELPKAVKDWAGLEKSNPNVIVPNESDWRDDDDEIDEDDTHMDSLAELNDSGDYDFNRIAGLIEDQFITEEEPANEPASPLSDIQDRLNKIKDTLAMIDQMRNSTPEVVVTEDEPNSFSAEFANFKQDEAEVKEQIPFTGFVAADDVDIEQIMGAVVGGTGTFVGGNEDTEDTLTLMRGAFFSGARYGYDFADEHTDTDEINSAFDVYLLAQLVTGRMLTAMGMDSEA